MHSEVTTKSTEINISGQFKIMNERIPRVRGIQCKFALLVSCLVLAWNNVSYGITISDLGLNASGNRELRVEVSPDPGLFSDTGQGPEGALAIELAFEVTGSELMGAAVNTTDWPWGIPGNNPFSQAVTEGIDVDLGSDSLFASLGSDFFTSGDAVEVFVLETMGAGPATVSWGGHTLLPGTPQEYVGSRISQAGIKFDGLQGALAVLAIGDMDGSGSVDSADVPLFVLALSDRLAYELDQPGIDADVIGDFDGNGKLDLGDVAGFKATVLGPAAGNANTVPEPTGGLLLLAALCSVLGVRRHAS